MKTRESIAIAKVNVFEAGDWPFMVNRLTALQIFVSELSNRLGLALASTGAVFKPIYQKFVWRRMDENYGF